MANQDMAMHPPGTQIAYPAEAGRRLRYYLYLPPGLYDEPGKKWPVLCFLHGVGEAAVDKEGNAQGIDAVLKHNSPPWHCQNDSAFIREFIVLSPQRPSRGKWREEDYQEIDLLLQKINREQRGDPAQSFLTGFSYGGEGVFDFAAWCQAKDGGGGNIRWAALWPVDDAADVSRTSSDVERIWLHFGRWEKNNKADPAKKYRLQLETVQHLGLTDANRFPNQVPPADRLYSDHAPLGHTQTCAAAYRDERVYRWLLR